MPRNAPIADRSRGLNGPLSGPHSVPGRNRANHSPINAFIRCRRPNDTAGGVRTGAGATPVFVWQSHPKPCRLLSVLAQVAPAPVLIFLNANPNRIRHAESLLKGAHTPCRP